MIWVLLALVAFLALVFLVYRWAAAKAPKGAFRGRGSFSGAGVDDQFRDDDPQSEQLDDSR
jgi:hypothetical protein